MKKFIRKFLMYFRYYFRYYFVRVLFIYFDVLKFYQYFRSIDIESLKTPIIIII